VYMSGEDGWKGRRVSLLVPGGGKPLSQGNCLPWDRLRGRRKGNSLLIINVFFLFALDASLIFVIFF